MRQAALALWAYGYLLLPQPGHALAPALAGARAVPARAAGELNTEVRPEESAGGGELPNYNGSKAETATALTVAARPMVPLTNSVVAAPGFDSEVLSTVMYARKAGPHHWEPWSQEGLSANIQHLLLSSASAMDWCFLGAVLSLLIVMDAVVLQQLPETARTHVILLLFWILVAVAFCMETWLRLGQQSGTHWLTGYFLEVVFSIDSIFVIQLIFCTFQTPRRLTAKAMFVGLVGAILFRLVFFLGLAAVLDRLRFVPYLLGILLVYCGTSQVTSRDEEGTDVTQTATVRVFRYVLGERLGDFYDEEREAIFAVAGQKLRMTLLGVVVASLLAIEFLLGLDVVLTKAEGNGNAYLNFSSSAVAMFGIRALFFVARDVFNRFTCTRYGIGLVLLFVGTEMLLARSVYVNALMSSTVIVFITISSIGLSSLRGLTSKPMT